MKKYSHKYNVILDNMDLNNYRIRPVAAIMYLQDAFARFTATKKMAAYDLFSMIFIKGKTYYHIFDIL